MTLYIATSNPGKLRDFAAANTENIEIVPLPSLKDIPPPPEHEPTFEGNAQSKAVYYSRYAPGEIVIADDSGLEVVTLRGAPGVRSARFAEDHNFTGAPSSTADERNNLCLIAALQNAPDERHPARYRCVLAAARDGKILCTGTGTVEGEILAVPRGTHGFGYDPLFYLPEYGKTMAELDLEAKLSFSHRGRAFRALVTSLDGRKR
jgi:XTP/dITP diphosphohydrolase